MWQGKDMELLNYMEVGCGQGLGLGREFLTPMKKEMSFTLKQNLTLKNS
jgi:hypothetical protein